MIAAAVLLFLAPPPSFTKAVQQIADATQMHVVDWWSDDLDGDKTPESIAMVCNDSLGLYVVQHGTEMLTAPMIIDGRNNCPDASGPPKWHAEHGGTIGKSVSVHHGHTQYQIAIREGRLAVVGQQDNGFDVARDGGHDDEAYEHDYDKLTWKKTSSSSKGKTTTTSGSLVMITEKTTRATTIRGTTTLSATRTKDVTTLHVHTDKAFVLKSCNDAPCKSTPVAKGDSDLVLEAPNELDVVGGGATVHLVFESVIDGGITYPKPSEY